LISPAAAHERRIYTYAVIILLPLPREEAGHVVDKNENDGINTPYKDISERNYYRVRELLFS